MTKIRTLCLIAVALLLLFGPCVLPAAAAEDGSSGGVIEEITEILFGWLSDDDAQIITTLSGEEEGAGDLPNAGFTANVTDGRAPLTVQFTDLSTGNVTSRLWDFGDGNTSTEQHPTHTYTSPGTYTVNLTVNNAQGGDSEVKTGYITVLGAGDLPTINYTACDQPVYQQDLVLHRSAGTAYEETVGNQKVWHLYVGDECKSDYGDVRFTNSTGSPLAYYLWPDYNSTSANFTVRLENADQAGTLHVLYGDPAATTTSNGTATFAFFDDYSDAATLSSYTELADTSTWGSGHELQYKEITGGQLHLGWDDAHYGSSLLYVNCPLSNGSYRIESRFRATGVEQYELLRHQKEIGLTTATTPAYDASGSPAIEFSGFGGIGIAMPGNGGQTAPAGTEGSAVYTLNATVRYPGIWLQDVGGSEFSEIWLDHLLVRAYSTAPPTATEFPPNAGFTANVTAGRSPLTVQFTDTSTGFPTAWLWSFGDGNTSTEQHPVHTYVAPGAYSVTLNASNDNGVDVEEKTDYIVVKEPEVPLLNLEDYQYTKAYYINGSSDGDLDNYQIKITLHNTTGDDSGSDVYLGSGIVQPDYDDVVFVDQYGVPIPHGYLSFTGSSAETWVRIPSIPAGSESQIPIYIHYGNATIAGRDSLHDVFQLYEPWDGNAVNQVATAGDVAISTLAGKYEAWPGIARDPDTGTMWVIYRTSDSNTHAFDSTGRVVVRKSEDDGATWGPEVIVSDIPGVDDRNAAISWVDNDGVGTLIAAYATYASNGASQYTFVKTSTDGGVTWGPAIPVQAGQARTPYGPCGMNSQGDLWICTYNLNGVFYDVSADGGETWAEYVVSNGYGSETAIIETKTNGVYSGGMLAVIRDDSSPCSYYITRSSDYGHTWDAVTQTGVFPSPYPTPVYLFRTSDDYILLAYTDTSLNLRIYQSYDEGLHWDYKGIVVSGQSISYYPAITQINDSTLYVVWCTNDWVPSDVYGNYVEYPLRAQWAITSNPPTTLTVNNGYLTIGNTGGSTGNINRYLSSIGTFGADTALIISEKSDSRTTQMGYGICTYPTRGNFAGFIPNDASTGIPFISRSGTTGTSGSPYLYNPSTFSRYEVMRDDTSVTLIRNQISDVLTTNIPTGSYSVTLGNGYHGGGGLTDQSCVDFVAVRKYTTHEPVHGVEGTTPPPLATSFTANVTAGNAPLTVQFTDTSTGSPTTWLWDFGDGSTSTQQHPTHTYTAPGIYTVTLTVRNAFGEDAEIKTGYITVQAPPDPPNPPVAGFTTNVTAGNAPLTVQFTDTSTGSPTTWLWNFGDGSTSTQQHPTHTYTAPGIYTVTLTVTNQYGTTSASHNLRVFATPTSPSLNGSAFKWDPETGYYTSYWFNREGSFIDVHGLFFALMLPLTQIFGSWVFLIIWGTLCMGLYLYTQDTTMPFIVGILGGSMMAFLMGEDALVVMLLTMAFAGGGILAKVLLGRV